MRNAMTAMMMIMMHAFAASTQYAVTTIAGGVLKSVTMATPFQEMAAQHTVNMRNVGTAILIIWKNVMKAAATMTMPNAHPTVCWQYAAIAMCGMVLRNVMMATEKTVMAAMPNASERCAAMAAKIMEKNATTATSSQGMDAHQIVPSNLVEMVWLICMRNAMMAIIYPRIPV